RDLAEPPVVGFGNQRSARPDGIRHEAVVSQGVEDRAAPAFVAIAAAGHAAGRPASFRQRTARLRFATVGVDADAGVDDTCWFAVAVEPEHAPANRVRSDIE